MPTSATTMTTSMSSAWEQIVEAKRLTIESRDCAECNASATQSCINGVCDWYYRDDMVQRIHAAHAAA